MLDGISCKEKVEVRHHANLAHKDVFLIYMYCLPEFVILFLNFISQNVAICSKTFSNRADSHY